MSSSGSGTSCTTSAGNAGGVDVADELDRRGDGLRRRLQDRPRCRPPARRRRRWSGWRWGSSRARRRARHRAGRRRRRRRRGRRARGCRPPPSGRSRSPRTPPRRPRARSCRSRGPSPRSSGRARRPSPSATAAQRGAPLAVDVAAHRSAPRRARPRPRRCPPSWSSKAAVSLRAVGREVGGDPGPVGPLGEVGVGLVGERPVGIDRRRCSWSRSWVRRGVVDTCDAVRDRLLEAAPLGRPTSASRARS